jgi:type IV secretion/conjugal transfer VirB4 family ATPase
MNARPKFFEQLGREKSIADYLPYSSHVAPDVIITRAGDFMRIFRVGGLAHEAADPEDVQIKLDQLNTLYRSIGSSKVALWTHTLRRKTTDRLDGVFDNDFCRDLNNRYYDSFAGYRMMASELYLTLIYRPNPTRFGRALNKAARRSIDEIKAEHREAIRALDDLTNQLRASMRGYDIEPLGHYDYEHKGQGGYTETIHCSTALEFLNFLITGSWQRVRVPKVPLNDYLGNAWLFVGMETIEIRTATQTRFAQALDFKDYVSFTQPGMLNELLYEDYEYVITQSFSFKDRYVGKKDLETQRNRLQNADEGGVSQIQQMSEAIDQLVNGEFAMGEYHFSMMVFGGTVAEARQNVSSAMSILQNQGFIAASVSTATDACFYAQLPCNWSFRPRVAHLTSLNFAGLSSFHNFTAGKRNGNPWGEAIAILKTPSGQPFYFNFHASKEDEDAFDQKLLGNTRIIGMSGAGKTVLMGFLYALAQKYKVRSSTGFSSVFFDKDRGAEILIRAMGGQYLAVETGQPTGFNPFQREPTEANILFLETLSRWLASRNGQKVTTVDEQRISQAVRTVMKMPRHLRGITTLTQNMTEGTTKEERENSIVKRLKRWCRGEPLGWVLDCENDVLDFGACSNFGIDGTEFLDNQEVCTPISMYLLHCMDDIIDGRRFMYFMDEFWKWLLDDAFSEFAFNKQKTIRKQNGLGVFATQSPVDVLRSPISRAIVEQCATEIYLPNPRANYRDYVAGAGGSDGDFGLTEAEFDLVKNLHEDSRMFLVKSGHRSAVARLDLAGFDDDLAVISGSTDNVELAHKVMQEVGEDPANWLPVFHERRRSRFET